MTTAGTARLTPSLCVAHSELVSGSASSMHSMATTAARTTHPLIVVTHSELVSGSASSRHSMAATAACTARTTHPLIMRCPQRAGQRFGQQQAPRNEQSKRGHGGCVGAPQSGKGAQHACKVCGAGRRREEEDCVCEDGKQAFMRALWVGWLGCLR